MSNSIFSPDKVNYILRFYLPVWDYERRFAEALQFCQETGAEHVMLFSDAQHIVWNQLTLDEARHEAEYIRRAVEDFGRHGITVGLNTSYNMAMSKADNRQHHHYDYWFTNADGSCQHRTPCQLDPLLDVYLQNFYTIMAETGVRFIYVDDDHRYIGTGEKNTWGCMCDLHISRFSQRTGRQWTREALHKAIHSDFDVRREWIAFLGESLERIANVIEKSVHKVNPEIKLGMMVPCVHQLPVMGHDPVRMVKIFQPDGKYLMRPCIGPYCDRDRMQIIPGLFYMEHLGALFGDAPEYTPEIETTPFTRFSKSMAVVRFHIAQGLINRMNNPALSVCGYVGNSPYIEPEFAGMLVKNRPFFETLRQNAPARGTRRGIQLCWKADSASATPENFGGVTDYFWPSFALQDILSNSGFAVTYDESKTKFLAGDSAWAFTDEEMKEALKGNLLLDAVAARAFIARGFGEYLGCDIAEPVGNFGAELCSDKEFSGRYHRDYIVLKEVGRECVYQLRGRGDSRVLTEIVDHDLKKLCDGMTCCTNKLGGKVCVTAFRINAVAYDQRHFICYQKQHILRQVLKFMDDTEPAYVTSPSCFAVQCFDNMLAVTNLSYDVAEEICIHVKESEKWAQGQYIADDGTLRPLSGLITAQSGSSLTLKITLPIFKTLFILPR